MDRNGVNVVVVSTQINFTSEEMKPNCRIETGKVVEMNEENVEKVDNDNAAASLINVENVESKTVENIESKDVETPTKTHEQTNGCGPAVKNGEVKPKPVKLSHTGVVKYSRIFKKVSPDGNMVLFLPQREIMVTETKVEPLMGVALIHSSVIKTANVKVFLQVVLTFR